MSVSTNAPTALSTDRVVLGIAMMLGFCACAPLLDVAAKLAAHKIPVAQITTARFVVQSVIMFPVALLLGFSFRVPRALMVPLIARAVFLIASTYCFVAAIAVMPIADALAIVFVEPFILLLLGRFFFSEPVGSRRLTASLVGFCGLYSAVSDKLIPIRMMRYSAALNGDLAALPDVVTLVKQV
ncbi:DMT family transporter [bacterium]|nr:DMT family transporter [bacterium]